MRRIPPTLPERPDNPERTGYAEPLQGDGAEPPAWREPASARGGIAAGTCRGIGQVQPAGAGLPACPEDPPCRGIIGIMVAPAGTANAVPGDAAIASIRRTTAHALFRIMILRIFTIVINNT
jgi:hypothetical protein